jgi:hypothetical protein
MIKFRQKMYIAPALLSAGKFAMNGLNVAGQASMIGGVIQGQQQMKQADEHQEQNAKLQKQQIMAENRKAEAIQNLANSGAGGTAAGQAIQYAASDTKILKNQKLFARYNMQDVKGFGKDMLGHLKKNKKHITGFLGFGVTMTAGKYLADKLIQQDKSVMTKPDEKTYSINFSNDIGNFKGKMNIKAAVPALMMGSLTPVASYLGDKAQQASVAKKSKKKKEKEFSISSKVSRAAKKGIIAIKRGAWNRKQNMKVIDKITNGPESKIRDPRTWHWLKKVRHNPVRGLANVYNSMSMMGGETGMKNFQNSLTGKGSSGSRLSKDISDFMSNHGATSMAAIGAIGGSALMGMSNLADKVSEKGFRLADKNAFKYTDSKEERVD